MPFYDLHVPWAQPEAELQRTLTFLHELGYDVVALSHTLSGKLPADLTCPIPETLKFPMPTNMTILRRCTLVLTDPSQNHRLSTLASNYDLLALRPVDEKTLQQACQSDHCDIISIDLALRFESHFKMKMLSQAVERGTKIELCYAPSILSTDSTMRRNVISNATQLIRATRGRGLIISSGAVRATGCRGPADVINLAAIWGLGQERGKEAITKLARSITVTAKMKRTSYRGVVDIVYGGEKPRPRPAASTATEKKRKAETTEPEAGKPNDIAKPLSKREQKRRRKAATLVTQEGDAVPTEAETISRGK